MPKPPFVKSDSTPEFFRLLVDAVVDYAIFALDSHGYIMSWNKGAQRLKGYAPDEIIGKHFSTFYTEEDIKKNHPEFELEQASLNGVYKEEGWRIRKDGTRFWASVVITALKDTEGKLQGFAKVTRDLTEKKMADDALIDLNATLEKRVEERTAELEKAVAARDQFVSIASHELKTPLTTLKLQNELRKHEIAKVGAANIAPAKIEKMIQSNEKQLERLIRLVDDMLDISRLTLGKFQLEKENINLATIVEDVLDRYRPQFETNGIELTVNLTADLFIQGDKFRLEQVVANLLTNSIKYGNSMPVHVVALKENQRVIVKIIDQGIGIDEKNLYRVFEQFERAVPSNMISGLGLGLYICRQIIEAHHGEIWVESVLGKGSEFIFSLPEKTVI